MRDEDFLGGSEETSPLPPSKGEMRRASIHEQYDVGTNGRLGKAETGETSGTGGTGESASRTGDCGTGGTNETGGSASRTGGYGTGGILCKKKLLKDYR